MAGGRKGYSSRCSAAICHGLEELNDIEKIEPDDDHFVARGRGADGGGHAIGRPLDHD